MCGRDGEFTRNLRTHNAIRDLERPMRQFAKNFVKFLKTEDGPTAVEYAVMLALIIVVCIGAITTLGNNANTTFGSVGTTIGGTGS
jgi:pilus assembly protein Flp/PilA